MSTPASHKQTKGTTPSPDPQAQSILFTLPTELRLRIFSLVLDCPPIPLAIIAESTGGRKLTLSTPGVGGPAVTVIREQRPLSLPLTCARAHAEALPLLYCNNTFLVGDSEILPTFARGIYAPWVRRLDFSWTRSKPPPSGTKKNKKKRFGGLLGRSEKKDSWDEVWKAVESLKGLQWIRLEICVPYTWTEEWRQREEELLTPLKGILQTGADGELTLTWQKLSSPGKQNAEDLLQGWVIKRRPWGAGFDHFPDP